MKTLSEIKGEYDYNSLYGDDNSLYGAAFTKGYEVAINGILKDIQESSATSMESIEKYLKELLK